ncbi:GTP-binding protein [Carex littledalei]|uniref:GTP-binding protein n=1 Tax=Carex littledalei TaxID=544730 RepID=A0A833VE71_9POAL|nr:GTP-binding protein [Carex littledalei]
MLVRTSSRIRKLLSSQNGTRNRPTFLSFFATTSRRNKGKGKGDSDSESDDRKGSAVFLLGSGSDPSRAPKLFVVQPRLRPEPVLQSKLEEALNLANSLEQPRDGFYEEEFESKGLPPHLVVQNPAIRSTRAHADTYFGPGTVDNIKCHLRALETESGIDAVFVNAILSGIQLRNLEAAWGQPVMDRVGLIIEIFNAHAETREAKLQSELAALMYKKTRLVRVQGPGGRLTFGQSGEAEVVSARGRGSGGQGFISGAGETELQLQRRRIQERRNRLLVQIEEVRRTRALHRSSRRRHGCPSGQGLATVAVVGYTNAGKSTLVSALSDTDLYSDSRLFATVDPRLRSVILPSGRKALLSDTVGFISDLPIQLVEAFHATLEEVVEADLLVHVLDSSAPDLEGHRSTVLQVLQQIGVSEDKIQNMIEVWNKIDVLEENIGGLESQTADDEEYLTEADKVYEEEESEEYNEDEQEDELASELSSSELLDDDNDNSNHHDGGKVEYGEEECEDIACSVQRDLSICQMTEMPPNCHVKTSALTGAGLQELLQLIDQKLEKQRNVVQRSYGPFDRKWRPSISETSTD